MTTEPTKTIGFSNRTRLAITAAALVAVGGIGGAIAVGAMRPSVEMAPIRPVAIHSLVDSDAIITLKGRVDETYGNKFVMTDMSGRALVDTGREGENRQIVSIGQVVTVQGRFEHGFVHASFLIGADGKVVSLRPIGPPHGPGGRHGPDQPRGDHGPDRDAAFPPPPPPPPVGDRAPLPLQAPVAPSPASGK
jgi:hypothetical protein